MQYFETATCVKTERILDHESNPLCVTRFPDTKRARELTFSIENRYLLECHVKTCQEIVMGIFSREILDNSRYYFRYEGFALA